MLEAQILTIKVSLFFGFLPKIINPNYIKFTLFENLFKFSILPISNRAMPLEYKQLLNQML